MKVLKKLLLGAMVLTTSLGLFVACGEDDSSDNDSSIQAPASSTTTSSQESTQASSQESVQTSSTDDSSSESSEQSSETPVSSEETESSSVCTTHTGGTATCKTLATCDTCGAPYGELTATNHEDDTFIYANNEDGTHSKKNACCKAVVETTAHVIDGWDTTDEDYDYGKCVCGYIDETVSFKKSVTDERKEFMVTATDAAITTTGCDEYVSVKDIKVGEVSLGNNLSALVFADDNDETQDLINRADLHGETNVSVIVEDESGSEHVISVPVLLVTGTLSTTQEFYDALYPVRYETIEGAVEGVDRTLDPKPVIVSGYYKLANNIKFASNHVRALGKGYYLDPANPRQGELEGTVSARTNGWFEGTLDGCGYTVEISGTSYGTFNSLNGATIKNVNFVDNWYYGSIGWACALAYTMENTTLDTVTFSVAAASASYGTGVGSNYGYLTSSSFKGNTLKDVTIDLNYKEGQMLAVGSLFGSGMDATNVFENVKLMNCAGIEEYGHDGIVQYKDASGFTTEITLTTDILWNEIRLSDETFDIWLLDPESDDYDGIPDGETVLSLVYDGVDVGDSLQITIEDFFSFADLGERTFTVTTLYGEGVYRFYTVPVTVVEGEFDISEIVATETQDIVLSAQTQSIDVSAYVDGYTVSGINFGVYSFGNDPANLIVPQAVKDDTANHGASTVTVIAQNDDGVVIVTVPVILVTKMITTQAELKEAFTYSADKRVVYGYYKLANDIGYYNSGADNELVEMKNETLPGSYENEEEGFRGTFDGGNFAIYCKDGTRGLFGEIGKGALITNVTFNDYWYSGSNYVTLLATSIIGATIENVNFNLCNGNDTTTTSHNNGWISTLKTKNSTFVNVNFNAGTKQVNSLFGGVSWDGYVNNVYTNCTLTAGALIELGHYKTLDPISCEGVAGLTATIG